MGLDSQAPRVSKQTNEAWGYIDSGVCSNKFAIAVSRADVGRWIAYIPTYCLSCPQTPGAPATRNARDDADDSTTTATASAATTISTATAAAATTTTSTATATTAAAAPEQQQEQEKKSEHGMPGQTGPGPGPPWRAFAHKAAVLWLAITCLGQILPNRLCLSLGCPQDGKKTFAGQDLD